MLVLPASNSKLADVLSENTPALQGVVESRTLEDNGGARYTLLLFSRRSRLHPGMRYIARGLNALASPGNEIECEQVPPPSEHPLIRTSWLQRCPLQTLTAAGCSTWSS